MTFSVLVNHFEFRAAGSVYFPAGKAGNVLRGALESRLVRERLAGGPSGLADPPRPYIFRAAHLDGKRFEPGETFSLDVHVFEMRTPLRDTLMRVFSGWEHTGLGPGRARVELLGPGEEECVRLELNPCSTASRCTVIFRTPTELKGLPARLEMPFDVLFARVRDRISTLRHLYGDGPLDVDFRGMAERARGVRTVRCDLAWRDVMRRSSRSGQAHAIGGVTGTAEYAGAMAEFVPWLRAAQWTGVGRHTVWGNGAIEVA